MTEDQTPAQRRADALGLLVGWRSTSFATGRRIARYTDSLLRGALRRLEMQFLDVGPEDGAERLLSAHHRSPKPARAAVSLLHALDQLLARRSDLPSSRMRPRDS